MVLAKDWERSAWGEKMKGLSNRIVEKFGKYDLHGHTFSACVFSRVGVTSWDKKLPDKAERLRQIRERFIGTLREAEAREVVYLALTEHPCWDRYSVSFDDHHQLITGIINNTRNSKQFLKIYYGVESNIKMDPNTKEVYIDLRDPTSSDIKKSIGIIKPTPEEITLANKRFERLNPIIASVHYQHFNPPSTQVKGSDGYLNLLLMAIKKLREILDEQTEKSKEKKIGILGHPWGFPSYINKTEYKNRYPEQKTGKKPQKKNVSLENFMRSDDVPIPYFKPTQLDELCSSLVKYAIYPEINNYYIRRGDSDIQKDGYGAPIPIIQHYIEFCEKNNEKKIVSISGDYHAPTWVGKIESVVIAQRINNIEKATAWPDIP